MHPDFNLLLIRNDIGLLHLKTDIVYNDVVQPISVASTNSILIGEPCILTGWGTLEVRRDEKSNIFVHNTKICFYIFLDIVVKFLMYA